MKKLIALPILLLMLTAVIGIHSCKKDSSTNTNLSEFTNAGQPTAANCYTITSTDGHVIGINGHASDTIASHHPKMNYVMSCSAASDLTVQAVSNTYGDRALYNGWTPGHGALIQLFINGNVWVDPASGYTLWSGSVNGLTVAVSGICSGSVFNNFVRTYCNQDTTGSSYYDSPVTSYTVDSMFVCGPGGTTDGVHHGHKH